MNYDNVARQVRGVVRKRTTSVIDFGYISGSSVDGEVAWDVESNSMEVGLKRQALFRAYSISNVGIATHDARIGNAFDCSILDGNNHTKYNNQRYHSKS